jgi:hypothetical protein
MVGTFLTADGAGDLLLKTRNNLTKQDDFMRQFIIVSQCSNYFPIPNHSVFIRRKRSRSFASYYFELVCVIQMKKFHKLLNCISLILGDWTAICGRQTRDIYCFQCDRKWYTDRKSRSR